MELLSASLKNMEITVFGVKLRIGVIILIVVLYWLLWGHVLCSCSRGGLLEGLEVMTGTASDKKCFDKSGNPIICGPEEATNAPSTTMDSSVVKPADLMNDASPVAATVNPDLPSLKPIEGFVGANTNYGESSKYSLTNNKRINTSSWFAPNLTYSKGGKEGKSVQNILNRPKQQIPLPDGQMLMFANTEFKPDCCPNAYSNSMGCACMTVDQYNYLIDRGGNNVPYSEY
jgi:hypothetical protein